MADSAPLRFIRKNGRIIPIRAGAVSAVKHAQVAGGVAGTAYAVKKAHTKDTKTQIAIKQLRHTITRKPADIQPNKLMKFGSTALSAAEGVVSGLGIGAGTKGFAASTAASFGLEAGTIGLAAGAYVGKGRKRERVKEAAKLEVVNQAVGWATYGATVLGRQKGREALVGYASKILAFGRKALKVV